MERPRIRIFLSSPGDVVDERRMALRVMDRLKGEFAGAVELEPIVWEHEPIRATQTFQDQIPPPSSSDALICILWSRLGTRLPGNYRRPDGSVYDSGTAFELETARETFEKAGRPDILVYRKTAPPLFDVSNREEREQRMAQWDQLADYLNSWFRDPDGSFKAGFTQFQHLDEFEDLLERHLRKLIRDRLAASGEAVDADAPAAPTWLRGSPFLGLQPFDVEHADVFRGRTRAVAEAKGRLQRNALDGRAFLLVTGMSGSGKSSLVRAGLLPSLTVPGAVEGVGLWRWAILRPSDRESPEAALLHALFAPSALPELGQGDFATPEALAALVDRDPDFAVAPVAAALQRAAAKVAAEEKLAAPPPARLLLVVDQLEELFSREEIGEPARRRFAGLLRRLAESGHVWVVGTLRSDFFHRCADLPDLVALKDGVGTFDLLPPSPPEIAQIVRQPARAAGLVYEVNAEGTDLADAIQQAAAANPASLPLLSFVLDELYKAVQPSKRLTFAAYEALGGLEGAIAKRAEEVVAAQPPQIRACLPGVLRALVTIGEGQAVATARSVPSARFAEDPDAAALVEALVEARLLVRDEGTVRVAHEALLTGWPRAAQIIEENREFLQVRARVQADAGRWLAEDRNPELLLPPGLRLSEAVDVLLARREELEPDLLAYVEASKAREETRLAAERAAARRKLRVTQAVAAAVAVLALLAGGAAVEAWRQSGIAEERRLEATNQREEAERQAAAAVAAREEAERQAAAAEAARQEADAQRAEAEAQRAQAETARTEAERQAAAAEAARQEADAQRAEAEAQRAEAEAQRLEAEAARAEAELNLAEARVAQKAAAEKASLAQQEKARAEELALSALTNAARLQAQEDPTTALVTWVQAVGRSLEALGRVVADLDAATSEVVDTAALAGGTPPDDVRLLDVANDAAHFLLADAEGTSATVVDLQGEPVESWPLWQGRIAAGAFHPGGRDFALGFETGALVLMADGEPLEMQSLDGPIRHISFDPLGRFLLAATDAELIALGIGEGTLARQTVRRARLVDAVVDPYGPALVWTEADGRIYRAAFRPGAEPQVVVDEEGELLDIALSHDGRLIAAATAERTVRLWTLESGDLLFRLFEQPSDVLEVGFTPADREMAIRLADGTVRYLDIDTRQWARQGSAPFGGRFVLPAFSPLDLAVAGLDGAGRPSLWSPGWRSGLWRACRGLADGGLQARAQDEAALRAQEICRALVWSTPELPWLQAPWALANGYAFDDFFWLREQDAGRTDVAGRPLPVLATAGDVDWVLQRLAGEGADGTADVQGQRDARGNTALILAAALNRADLLRLLLGSAEADLDARNDDGQTALLAAAQAGAAEAVELLLAAGADPTVVDFYGTSVAEALVAQGLDGLAADLPTAAGVGAPPLEDPGWQPDYLVPEEALETTRRGLALELGAGVERCFQCAVAAYRDGAALGDGFAMYLLSRAYRFGNGVPQSDTDAFVWAWRAVDAGSAHGMNALANAYAAGRGVKQNHDRAAELYRRAAQRGNRRAMYNVGYDLEHGTDGYSRDLEAAATWYESAAAFGDRTSKLRLGVMLHHGWGRPVDSARALELLHEAAEAGESAADLHLGQLYEQGIPDADVAPSIERAHAHYEAAARHGNTTAMVRLARLIETGAVGEPDAELAFTWYVRAARRGQSDAASRVARMLAEGTPYAAGDYAVRHWLRVSGKPFDRRAASLITARLDRSLGRVIERMNAVLPLPGAPQTRNVFDEAGRLVRQETPDTVRRFAYHPLYDKIVSVVEIERESARGQVRTDYAYDRLGNLVSAARNDGSRVELEYDARQRIVALTAETGERLLVSYGTGEKPTRIEMEGVGAVEVAYDAEGEIASVESEAGPEIAFRITQLFQSLLSLVRHAEVDL
jgi:YD repeat-containing protein